MMRRDCVSLCISIALGIIAMASTPVCAAKPFIVFQDKEYVVPVVLPETPDDDTARAAKLLSDTLREITGVELTVMQLTQEQTLPEACIVLGPDLARRAEAALPGDLTPGGLMVKRVEQRLILAGAPQRGTYYAVADFLERELGCRWLSAERVILPKRTRVVAEITDRRDEPAFRFRTPLGLGAPEPAARLTPRAASDGNVHSFQLIMPPRTYFADHPDYYSWNFGSNRGSWFHETGQINYHNPEVRKIMAQKINKDFESRPNWAYRWVSQQDCFGWSEDHRTSAFDAKHGTVAASHVDFINAIAQKVAQTHPDKQLSTLAYLQTLQVPEDMRYEPNVRLYVCEPDGLWGHAISEAGRFGKEYFQLLKRWGDRSNETFTWFYYNFMIPKYYMSPDIAGLPADFRAFQKAGVEGIFGEVYTSSKRKRNHETGEYFTQLRGYLIAKLCWNPGLDAQALIRDFHLHYFGPKSGPIMLNFYHEAVKGQVDFDADTWGDAKLTRLQALASQALEKADDDFARREIQKSLRSVTVLKLMKKVGPWHPANGRWSNGYAEPGVDKLVKRFDTLTAKIGDEKSLDADKIRYDQAAFTLENNEIELTVVPAGGGAITRIVDRRSGQDYAGVPPVEIGGTLVGGYQELAGSSFSSPGIRNAFKVIRQDESSVTLAANAPKAGGRLERTISLVKGRPAFHVQSRFVNTSKTTKSMGFRTHPMVSIGKAEDVYFAYRTRTGRNVSEPIQGWECLSAGWGPTGLWAMINPKENRGLLWESPPVHNGHFIWANPFRNILGCETFSERAELKPDERLEMEQTFTILRDAKSWCEKQNMPVPFSSKDAARLPKPDVRGKRSMMRPLSHGEKWIRKHGLVFTGWYSQDIQDPKHFKAYQALYPYAMPTDHKNVSNITFLESVKMPWILLSGHGPFDRDGWRNNTLPDVTWKGEAGYLIDEDVLWGRDVPTGRVAGNRANVKRIRQARPDALTILSFHAWNREYGCIRLADFAQPDVVVGEVYPFIHASMGNSLFRQLNWAREAGMRTGRPWWNFIQTFGIADPGKNGGNVRLPSESEQRLQVFAALTWGYTGFLDYYYALTDKIYERGNSVPLLVTPDGKPTEAYHAQKQIIRETMNLGRGLSQLRHLDAGGWKARQRLLHGLGVNIDKAPVVIGRFCDDTGDDSYFMVTSTASHSKKDSSELKQTITLRLRPNVKLLRLDRLSGKVMPCASQADPGSDSRVVRIDLPGGTGTLFKIDNGKPFRLLKN